MNSAFTRTYNAFSNVDMRCFIGDKEIGILQGLSYQVSREMMPIYTMGNPPPPKKRRVAGTLKFIQFDVNSILFEYANNEIAYDTCRPMEHLEQQFPCYPDEIPAFDIVMTVANEYGAEAQMKILDVKLLMFNEDKYLSVDDIVSEKPYRYIAEGLIPWTSVSAGMKIEKQDEHEGMIQNPITGEWRWF